MLRLLLIFSVSWLFVSCTATRCLDACYAEPNVDYRYEGILEQRLYKCSVDGPSERRLFVYLPADYYETSEHYPVLYLLHGARGDELSWITKGHLLSSVDSLTRNGLMSECIIVLPNTNQYKNDKDFAKSRTKGAVESFFENNGAAEYSLVMDAVRMVENSYRVIAEKSGRAIAGLSIGALQTIHISATYPEMFDYIGLFSPMVHPFAQHSEHSTLYKSLKSKQQAQFESAPKLYWIMIGRSDFFYPRMNSYCRYLKRNGYKHEYYISSGGHQWYNWIMYCNMFMQRLWD